MKNQRVQNASAVQASRLWYSHPMQLSHPRFQNYSMILEQNPPGVPTIQVSNRLAERKDITSVAKQEVNLKVQHSSKGVVN